MLKSIQATTAIVETVIVESTVLVEQKFRFMRIFRCGSKQCWDFEAHKATQKVQGLFIFHHS